MRDERLEVMITFDPTRGYSGSAPELRSPVVAPSLGGLRRRIEIALLPDDVDVRLILDRTAERASATAAASGRNWRATWSQVLPSIRLG